MRKLLARFIVRPRPTLTTVLELAGAVLIAIATDRLSITATLFVIGAECILIGALLG